MSERIAHKRAIRQAFDRAAPGYDRAAIVQRECCARLFALDAANPDPGSGPVQRLVDAGCGTGHALDTLRELFPDALPIALDFSPAMLRHACASSSSAALPLCADLEHLPLQTDSIDLLWSSLAMQWCDPQIVLQETARVLAPGGRALIATLGPRTLHELRSAFAAVDDATHVIEFSTLSQWTRSASVAGLDLLAGECAELAALAPDLRTLLADIKAIGAHTVGEGRRRKALGRQAWNLLQQAYEQNRRTDGLLPATYDLVLLSLRKPA
ncbi:MAG: methyltransferase domain-containing protein [Azoarcus sp.]|nr:methyltransferase domain-containing protein [Azoarcus sp.]